MLLALGLETPLPGLCDSVEQIGLSYRCGCREVWQVANVDEADREHRSANNCPTVCWDCAAKGRPCPANASLPPIRPVLPGRDDEPPVRRLRKAS
ncbi:MAG: hypothetical protein NVS4B6_31100 [Mycobacterium sp.]